MLRLHDTSRWIVSLQAHMSDHIKGNVSRNVRGENETPTKNQREQKMGLCELQPNYIMTSLTPSSFYHW